MTDDVVAMDRVRIIGFGKVRNLKISHLGYRGNQLDIRELMQFADLGASFLRFMSKSMQLIITFEVNQMNRLDVEYAPRLDGCVYRVMRDDWNFTANSCAGDLIIQSNHDHRTNFWLQISPSKIVLSPDNQMIITGARIYEYLASNNNVGTVPLPV